MEFQKNYMKFQIMREKIGICRVFLNWSGFESFTNYHRKNTALEGNIISKF